MEGLFQVIKKPNSASFSNGIVVGTAFIVQTLQTSPHEYYLLTAYHNIAESFAKNEPILIQDNEHNCHSVEIVYPDVFHSYSGSIFDDYALLKLVTDIEYTRFSIETLCTPNTCYIRGAALYFTEITNFTSFKGEMFWNERSAESDEEILILDIKTKSVFDNKALTLVDQQCILEGLSGSPIIVEQDKKYVVSGLFVRIHPDGCASKCYGIPMSSIVSNCLIPLGLHSNIFRDDTVSRMPQIIDLQDVQLYIDLLFSDPTKFSLEDCTQETKIWDMISNQFYHGFAVDAAFYRAISLDSFSRYSYDTQVAIRYYLARLLFKRGKRRDAYKQFSQITNIIPHLSANVSQRIAALLAARSVVESEAKIPQLELDRIRTCGDGIANLSSTDNIYVANELASIFGRGLTNYFGRFCAEDYSDSIKIAIKEVFDMHTFLLKKYPIPLQKQDVVNTSLRWLTNLWGVWHKNDVVILQHDALTGFEQALKRRNSIFHIQSLITYSISLLIVDSKKEALTALFLTALLMRLANLKLTHEGISQLLKFIDLNYHSFYSLFCLYYNMYNVDEKVFLEKSSLYSIEVSSSVIGALVQRAHYIVDTIYQPLGQDIYLGKVENIIELL